MKFDELGLHPLVVAGVEANNYIDCTPIQASAIPHILAGHDLAGLAQTGTGKTAAFVVPMLDRIVRSREAAETAAVAPASEETVTDPSPSPSEASNAEAAGGSTEKRPFFTNWRKKNFVLVLVPTRELAEQVSNNIVSLGKAANVSVVAIYGGASYEPQKAALRRGVDFIVATPGRFIDLYKDHLVDLHQVRAVVFDEADRMFDMGFKDDMKFILRRLPRERQFLVFSATLNFDVLTVAYEFGANPVEVNVSKDQAKAENVEDEIMHIGQDEKPKFLLSLFKKHNPTQAIIFSNFKRNVESIARFLSANGLPAMGISSLMTQNQRQRIMNQFKAGDGQNILVATDLAARGLDIKGVDLVINFELPDDPENYVHRIGRTGRAGQSGRAVSMVSDRDVEALQRIENYLGHKITVAWFEDSEIVQDFAPYVRIAEREGPPSGGFQRSPKQGGDRGFRREGREQGHRGGRRDRRPDRQQRHGDGQSRPHEGRRHKDQRHHEKRHHEPRPHDVRAQDQRQQEGRHQEGRRQEGRHEGRRHGRHRDRRFDRNKHRQSGTHRRPAPAGANAAAHAKPQTGVVSKVAGFFSGLFKKKNG